MLKFKQLFGFNTYLTLHFLSKVNVAVSLGHIRTVAELQEDSLTPINSKLSLSVLVDLV